jgi:predicted nucleic acid-binding protein
MVEKKAPKEKIRDTILGLRMALGREFDSPRNEATDRMVRISLYGAMDGEPKGEADIRDIFSQMSGWQLSEQVLKGSLDRLIAKSVVEPVQTPDGSQAYLLTPVALEEIEQTIDENSQRMSSVVHKLLARLDEQALYRTANIGELDVIKSFQDFLYGLGTCLGNQCARIILGRYTVDDLFGYAQFQSLLGKSCRRIQSGPLREIVEQEIKKVLGAYQDDDAVSQLIFALAQNYYVVKLLGLDFNAKKLSRFAFRDTVALLDANVVIAALLPQHRAHEAFQNLAHLSKELSIEVIVSSETRQEVYGVAEDKYDKMSAFARMPDKYLKKAKEDFLRAFLEKRNHNEGLTWDSYFEPFWDLKSTMQKRFGIEVRSYDGILEEYENGQREQLEMVMAVVKQESRRRLQGEKKEQSARHDALHYLLVERLRMEGKEFLFVTLDTTLQYVDLALNKGEKVPFCITLDNWLQCLSPFASPTEMSNLSFLFTDSFSSELLLGNDILSEGDLRLLVDLEDSLDDFDLEEVPEQIALDTVRYVRDNILRGQAYTEVPKDVLMYGVQKYWAEVRELLRKREREWDKQLVEAKQRERLLEEQLQEEEKKRRKVEWIATGALIVFFVILVVFLVLWFSRGR